MADDLISRRELLKNRFSMYMGFYGTVAVVAVKDVENAPAVDAVEVIHAHWEMGVDEGDYEYGTCSVCGYNEYNAFGCLLPHNYCPNCGAKMDGGNEDG